MTFGEIIDTTKPLMDSIVEEFSNCPKCNCGCANCKERNDCKTTIKAETLVEVLRAILNNERKETDK